MYKNLMIKQGAFMSDLAKCCKQTARKDLSGNYSINLTENFTLQLGKYDGLKTSTLMTLIYLLHKVTQNGTYTEIAISMEEYISIRKICMDKARERIYEDLNAIFDMSIKCVAKNFKSKQTAKYQFRIIASRAIIRNKYLYVNFTDEFIEFYREMFLMNLDDETFAIDVRRNPNSFGLAWILQQHARSNYGKTNQNTLGVRSLLEYCPQIPCYDDEMRMSGQLAQRIIKPFERDLNALNIINWYYLDENNNRFEFQGRHNYGTFINLKVLFTFHNPDWCANYPQSNRRSNDVKLLEHKDKTTMQL